MGEKIKDHSEDSYLLYIREIKNSPLLSFEQEQILAQRSKEGDKEARQELIKSNLKLVIKIAMQYYRPRYNLMDLIQEGNIGLLVAVDKFNYKKKLRFSTYSTWWIKHYIIRSILQKEFHIYLPLNKGSLLFRMERTIFEIIKKFNRTPDVRELEQELNVKGAKIKDMLDYVAPVLSLDSLTDSSQELNLMDNINSGYYQPEEIMFHNNLVEYESMILNSLIKRDAEILRYRYGFYNGKNLTLKNLAKIFNITSEAVRQIELKVLKKIRLQYKDLKSYLVY